MKTVTRFVLIAALVSLAVWVVTTIKKQRTPDPRLSQAAAIFDQGRFPDAIPLLEGYLDDRPYDLDARLYLGWCYYRAARFDEAEAQFRSIVRRDRGSIDGRSGLGYALLQTSDPESSAEQFRRVLDRDPNNRDALRGFVLAGRREGADSDTIEQALEAGRRLFLLEPHDRQLKFDVFLLSGKTDERIRPPVSPDNPIRVPVRAGRDYLETREADGSWTPLFIKGFNLGAARPGAFPTGFPNEVDVYVYWLSTMSNLGANTVRLYTLLPPEFYDALVKHNRAHPDRRLWLIQGVWAELPPKHDFLDERYFKEFRADIARVIDAVHGNLMLAHRPGSASGIYEADASEYLLAYIIGREWEPFAVKDFNAMHRGEKSWSGTWLKVEDARPMECWVARSCDFAADYEANRYRTLHPLTFANWPTLDPLHHPTESTRTEENRWRAMAGMPFSEVLDQPAWEDDAVSLDATLIRPTGAMEAGFFAAYHIYPNFPDFLNLEEFEPLPDVEGPTRYAAYIRDLKAYHGEQPVVIAEFGISTSRITAHLHPEGWHHGGLDEMSQGRIVSRMLQTIHEEKCAGAVVFEFMDEWFKSTWSVAPLEVPDLRRRLWFNAESPEQSYGILAARPGATSIRLDGDPRDWKGVPPLVSETSSTGTGWGDLRALRVTSDEGYLHLLLETGGAGHELDWSGAGFRLAFDTYDPKRGEERLPGPAPVGVASRVEFILDLMGPGKSFVRVTPPYEPHDAERRPQPLASPRNPTGRFVPLYLTTNRERFGRDGRLFEAQRIDRGELRFGSLDTSAPDHDSRADVAVGLSDGVIEIRLPWGMLNVSDPSSRQVLHNDKRHHVKQSSSVTTPGFRIYAFAFDPSTPGAAPVEQMPPSGEVAPMYTWSTWENPQYRFELKEGADLIGRTMNEIPDRVER